MKRTILISILASITALGACGGGQKPDTTPKDPKDPDTDAPDTTEKQSSTATAPDPTPEPPPAPAPPPPPKAFHAQADMKPLKGAKIKGTTVTFSQTEGDEVEVGSMGWFDGIKAGKFHLVVHQGADCGANGAKAGKAIAATDMPLASAKGQTSVDIGKVATVQLDGDGTIVGHALVLHADAKGKPGKPLACGAIASAGGQ
jgi:hypothetical protein